MGMGVARIRAPQLGAPTTALLISLPGWLVLVIEPIAWLWTTWSDPSYQSDGHWTAVALLLLVLRSLASGPPGPAPHARRIVLALVLATGLLRIAGVVLAIRILGGLALVADVAALAVWLRLDRRPWSLHLGWFTALAAFALPIENGIQRIAAHPLQLAATASAEALLGPWFANLTRHGTVLSLPDLTLGVDVPCSGAHGLWLLLAVATFCLTRREADARGLAWVAIATACGAFAGNTLRVVFLFVGMSWNWPVREGPLHEAIGALTLAVALAGVVWACGRLPPRTGRGVACAAQRLPDTTMPGALTPGALTWIAAGIVSICALLSLVSPATPADRSPAVAPDIALPARLGSFVGRPASISQLERRYFSLYGGNVEKRSYHSAAEGDWSVVRVRTQSPLRHLHGPDRCLLGAGHQVTRLGVLTGTVPSVAYRSVAPDGRAWRVEASFVSDEGEWASGVPEVVWRWLQRPSVAWSLIERISPWQTCDHDRSACQRFDAALFAALDLPNRPVSHSLASKESKR